MDMIQKEECSHTQIYFLGCSQNATVRIREKFDSFSREVSNGTTATFTLKDGLGILDVYISQKKFDDGGEREYTGGFDHDWQGKKPKAVSGDAWWSADYLIEVDIDGYVYRLIVSPFELGYFNSNAPVAPRFYISPEGIYADGLTQGNGAATSAQVVAASSNATFRNNSAAFIPSDWVDTVKEKVTNELENQLISYGVGLLLKLIF